MKSDMIIVASNGNGLQEALLQTEKVAEQYHLSPKDTLHLRLLVEEMLNMMRSINSEHVGQFWIDATEKEASEDRDHNERQEALAAAFRLNQRQERGAPRHHGQNPRFFRAYAR